MRVRVERGDAVAASGGGWRRAGVGRRATAGNVRIACGSGRGSGAPKTNRTSDLPLRRGLLYPLSYRGVDGRIVQDAARRAVRCRRLHRTRGALGSTGTRGLHSDRRSFRQPRISHAPAPDHPLFSGRLARARRLPGRLDRLQLVRRPRGAKRIRAARRDAQAAPRLGDADGACGRTAWSTAD